MNKHLTLSLVLASGLVLSACSKKAPEMLPPDPGGSAAGQTTDGTGSTAPVPGSQADFVAQMMGQDTILFDTDRYNIDATDQTALATQAQWLARYPAKRISVEGHADDRGTREYNPGLGERRANAARNYLVSLGVDPGRITTVSHGKEKPLALGSDEAS